MRGQLEVSRPPATNLPVEKRARDAVVGREQRVGTQAGEIEENAERKLQIEVGDVGLHRRAACRGESEGVAAKGVGAEVAAGDLVGGLHDAAGVAVSTVLQDRLL